MPGFDPNTLKPEEELSGFGLSEPDGDIFSLKEEYPEEVPQFKNEPEPLIDETPVEEFMDETPVLDVDADGISQAPLIETPESGSVWDAFEDDPIPQPTEETDEEAIEENIAQVEETVEETPQDIIDDMPDISEDDISAFAPDEEEVTQTTASEEPVDAFVDADVPTEAEEVIPEPEEVVPEPEEVVPEPEEVVPEPEEVVPEPEEVEDITDTVEETDVTLSLGDDLKQMLEEELNRSKARKEEAEKGKQDEEPIEKSDPSEFQPVEKIAETEFIDITDIDKDEKEAKAQKEDLASEEVIEDKKPKKKSKLLRNIGISAAAVVILAALGLGVFQYWYYPNFMVEQPQIAETAPEEKHEKGTHQEVAPESESKHEEHPAEIKASEEITEHKAEKEETKAPEHKKETAAVEHIEDVHTEKPVAQKDIAVKENNNKEAAKEVVPDKPKEKKTQQVASKSETKSKPKDVATTKKHKRINKKAATSAKEKDKEEIDALFAVQIYASPSKDDAEAWLDNLKDMDVDNPRISTQKIRDVIWYRVRFGNFKSKDDARNAAMRYGFAQTWIDRIK